MKHVSNKLLSFLILLLSIYCNQAFTQSSPPSGSLLPTVTSPSPDATSLAKYGNYEVSLFTGLPQISIPIYTIKDGELEVPISINYHASGIKVNEMESLVGIGWSLNAGGLITRQVEGLPDEQPYNYLSGAVPVKQSSNLPTPLNTLDLDYVQSVSNGIRDVEPDIFSFSFPGKSGKFVFNCKDNFRPIVIPYNPIQINRIASDQNSINFDIIDESGVKYTFGDKERTSANFTSNISSWRLSSMTSSNKSKVIQFIYSSETVEQEDVADFETITDGGVIYHPDNNGTANSYAYSNTLSNKYSRPVYTLTIEKKLSEIYFTNGKIVFNSTGRQLNSIIVYSGSNSTTGYKPIRTINFYYSYFIKNNDESTKRLRLDSVQMRGSATENIQTYKFGYNLNQLLPSKLSRARDYWGYYNNADNSTLVPGMTIRVNPNNTSGMPYDFHVGGSNTGRDPNPVYMQANILNRVSYPTGGYSEFEYETNQYDDGLGNAKFAGGLRIRTIKSYDGFNVFPDIKTYKYGVGENGLGRANFIMDDYRFKIGQTGRLFLLSDGSICNGVAATKNMTTYTTSPSLDINSYDGSPVVYPVVTEYLGTVDNNVGRSIYTYKDERDMFEVYSYIMTKPKVTSMHFARGLLRSKEVFKKINSGYKRVLTTENQYEAFPRTRIDNIGFVAYKQYVNNGNLPYGSNGDLNSFDMNPECSDYNDSYSYQFASYGISSGDNKLKQTIVTTFDPDDESKYVTQTTNYFFDDFSHQQPTKIETVNSKGETKRVEMKYPNDFRLSFPYSDMIKPDINVINKVVEERKLKINQGITTLLTLTRNNYAYWANNNYLPSDIEIQNKNNPIEKRVFFNRYDAAGNIQEMQKKDDVKEVYIWSSSNPYPLAKIVNGDYVAAKSLISQSILDNPSTTDAAMRAELNKLRVGLPKALVTTYTYSRLTGITSQTDPNNRTTYYDYDSFGRLKLIKDKDGKILKVYDYKYGQ